MIKGILEHKVKKIRRAGEGQMIRRIFIQQVYLKSPSHKEGDEKKREEFQEVEYFSPLLQRYFLRRSHRWRGQYHLNNRAFVDIDINGNLNVLVVRNLWRASVLPMDWKEEKLEKRDVKKNKKSVKKSSLSLVTQPPQKSRKKTKGQNDSGKLRCHLKIC